MIIQKGIVNVNGCKVNLQTTLHVVSKDNSDDMHSGISTLYVKRAGLSYAQ